MTLISNLYSNFETFTNVDTSDARLTDLNDSLDSALIKHVKSPGAFAFLSSGFGNSWKSSFKTENQPTEEMSNVCSYINEQIEKPIAIALSNQIKNCSVLMSTANPGTAQASVPIINAALSQFEAGAAIAATMNSSVAAAVSSGNLQSIPGIVSVALLNASDQIKIDVKVSYIKEMQRLDNDLEMVGLSQITKQRKDAWKLAENDILATKCPENIYPTEEGKKFWDTILQTIAQTVPD